MFIISEEDSEDIRENPSWTGGLEMLLALASVCYAWGSRYRPATQEFLRPRRARQLCSHTAGRVSLAKQNGGELESR